MCCNRQHHVFLYIVYLQQEVPADVHPTFLSPHSASFRALHIFCVGLDSLHRLLNWQALIEKKKEASRQHKVQKQKAFWIATSQHSIDKYKPSQFPDFFYKPLVHHGNTMEALHGSNLQDMARSGGWLPNFPNSQWSLGSGCRFWRKWSYRNVFQVWIFMALVVVVFLLIFYHPKNILYHRVWLMFMMLMIWRCHARSWVWSLHRQYIKLIQKETMTWFIWGSGMKAAWVSTGKMPMLIKTVLSIKIYDILILIYYIYKQNTWHVAYLLSTSSLAYPEMQAGRPLWFEKKKPQVTNWRIKQIYCQKRWFNLTVLFIKFPIVKNSVERKQSEKKNATEELSERAKVWSHAPPGANQESLLDSTIHVASLSTFLLLWLIWMNYTKVLSNLFFFCVYLYVYISIYIYTHTHV